MTAVDTQPLGKEIGRDRRRKEDARLITGRTRWTDNIVLPGMLHLAMVRSPFAHARITGIDTAAAKEAVEKIPNVAKTPAPVVEIVDYKTLFLDHTDEEKTVVRFTLAEDGNVVRVSEAEKSLIDTIAWKKTFRNMRR